MVFMRSILGYLAAAFCVVVWGGTFVNTSGLLEDFSSLEIMIIRFESGGDRPHQGAR